AEYWWFSLLYVIATGAVAGAAFGTETPLLGVLHPATMAVDGDPATNRYGPSPKAVADLVG
ncbi:hypothetical protein, partial [Streptomyces caniscabiei]